MGKKSAKREPFPVVNRTVTYCGNCDAPLVGPYCYRCGQRDKDGLDSLLGFIKENISEIVEFESRSLVTMVDLLFRPGRITSLYLSGRRAAYIQPLQLYLFASVVFFLVNSFTSFVLVDVEEGVLRTTLGVMAGGWHITPDWLDADIIRAMEPNVLSESLLHGASALLPFFLVFSVTLFTLSIALFYPGSERVFVSATVFSLHWSSFYLLLMAFDRLIGGPGGMTRSIFGILFSALAALHLIVALRRTYRQSWFFSITKGLMLFFIFNAFIAIWISFIIFRVFGEN